MALTPTTLPRHELIGLKVAVISASNADLVGLAGRVVAETTQTIAVTASGSSGGVADSASAHGRGDSADTDAEDKDEDGNRDKGEHTLSDKLAVIPKSAATFEWQLPTGERVRTTGERLIARPPRRTEHTGDSIWR